MGFEYNIIRFFQSNVTPAWLTFFQIITLLGSFLGLLIAFVIVFAKDKKLSVALLITFVLALAINFVLKKIIARSRPFDSYSDIINYDNESGYSMPSGHSLSSAVFATYVIYVIFLSSKNIWTRVLGTIAVSLFPMLVALSRMVLGVHYLTDTLLGMALGALGAIGSIFLYNYIIKKFNLDKRR